MNLGDFKSGLVTSLPETSQVYAYYVEAEGCAPKILLTTKHHEDLRSIRLDLELIQGEKCTK